VNVLGMRDQLSCTPLRVFKIVYTNTAALTKFVAEN